MFQISAHNIRFAQGKESYKQAVTTFADQSSEELLTFPEVPLRHFYEGTIHYFKPFIFRNFYINISSLLPTYRFHLIHFIYSFIPGFPSHTKTGQSYSAIIRTV